MDTLDKETRPSIVPKIGSHQLRPPFGLLEAIINIKKSMNTTENMTVETLQQNEKSQ